MVTAGNVLDIRTVGWDAILTELKKAAAENFYVELLNPRRFGGSWIVLAREVLDDLEVVARFRLPSSDSELFGFTQVRPTDLVETMEIEGRKREEGVRRNEEEFKRRLKLDWINIQPIEQRPRLREALDLVQTSL